MNGNGITSLRSLEADIARHCINSCANCNHFSPIQKRYFIDIDILKRDILTISKIFSFNKFSLLGGEPLLHPEIDEILEMVKSLNLFRQLGITTNGQLLNQMSEKFWTLFNRLEVDPYRGKLGNHELDLIRKRCKQNNIELQINDVSVFYKALSDGYQPAEMILDRFKRCGCKECFTICEGYLYRCARSMYIPSMFLDLETITDGIPLEGMSLDKFYKWINTIPKSCNICSFGEVIEPWHEVPRNKWINESKVYYPEQSS